MQLQVDQYRKRPVVIEAVQFTGFNQKELADWCGGQYADPPRILEPLGMDIPTLEGTMVAWEGDWIIKGVAGEFYPCKHDIFVKTYEAVIF